MMINLQDNESNSSIQQLDKPIRREIKIAALLWMIVTLIVLATTAGIYFIKDWEGLAALVQKGPISNPNVTLMSVVITWMLLGVIIALLYYRRINTRNIFSIIGFFIISLLYLNFLRERMEYGDVQDYVQAALNLSAGQSLNARYLYPPLWATLLQPLVPFGESVLRDICWLLNLLSLGAFYFILQGVLKKYGFSAHLSVLVTFAFMIVNVPILRTLCYVQVNLHVANLILISLLCYPKHRILSALTLCLATHLKVSPILLVLAFVFNKDLRWVFWFVLCSVAVACSTIAVNGVSPYQDFLTNVQNIYSANGIQFRENSFDSLFRAISNFLNIELWATTGLIALSKIVLVCVAFFITIRCVQRRTFYVTKVGDEPLYNAFPVLLVLMVITSPLVWEHHPVLLSLSYLVILRNLSSTRDWLWYGFAYFLEFLVPTFDFFPWSYGRLLSPLILIGLIWSVSKRPEPTRIFLRLGEWLENLTLPRMKSDHPE